MLQWIILAIADTELLLMLIPKTFLERCSDQNIPRLSDTREMMISTSPTIFWKISASTQIDRSHTVAPATGTDEPVMPIVTGMSGPYRSAISAGSGSTFPTPHDQANTGSRRTAERHRHLCHLWCHEVRPKRGAGFGFHLTASAVSSATRRLVPFRLAERLGVSVRADGPLT